jgi:phosphoribosyl 1,2-cyclic phosphodiesterase
MRIAPLGSGSGGNSYYVESGGTGILVDAGLGPRETAKRLAAIGESITSVSAIVITHEHYDHIRGAARIAIKRGVPVHMTQGTLDASRIDPAEVPVTVFENNRPFAIGEINVHPRRTLHDAADPACFVLEARDGTRFGIASDLGHVDPPVIAHLSGCDALFFESNHDLDMLRSGSYPWSLKRRIMSRYGHLSNDDAIEALKRMIGPRLQTLCMIHLSENNNHESIVHGMATALIDSLGAPIRLMIARQSEPLPAIEVGSDPRHSAVDPPPASSSQLALF